MALDTEVKEERESLRQRRTSGSAEGSATEPKPKEKAAKEEPPSPPLASSPVKPVQSKPAWEVFLALLLAIVFYTTIHGDGDFKGLEQNGFGLFAATVPGAHWGNWRSLTRCDCKSYSHCLTDLPPLSLNSTYSNVKALATCKLMSAIDEGDATCQISASAKKARLNVYRVFPWISASAKKARLNVYRIFPWELFLRLEVAADFRPAIALACYWILACTLLELLLFVINATMRRWTSLRSKGCGLGFVLGSEVLVWCVVAAQHEMVSYVAYRLYDDTHTTCAGTTLLFRDVFALYTFFLVFQRALGGGPSSHRQWESKAAERFTWLQERPWYLHVLLDPRIGALHRYSGIESKIFSDPVGVLTPMYNLLKKGYTLGMAEYQAFQEGRTARGTDTKEE